MFHPGVLLLIYESADMALEVPIVSTPNVGHKEHFADVYSKLNVFALTQFDKVLLFFNFFLRLL